MYPYMHKNNITWVQGIESARAYQMMPGSNAVLMDSDNEGVLYIKTCDSIGMCTIRTFKYEEVIEAPKTDMSIYVTKADLEDALKSIREEKNEQPLQTVERKSDIVFNAKQSTTGISLP